jgi:hypothetical protein
MSALTLRSDSGFNVMNMRPLFTVELPDAAPMNEPIVATAGSARTMAARARIPARVGADDIDQLVGRHGPPHQVTLSPVASGPPQRFQLFMGLDALTDDDQVVRVRQVDHSRNDGVVPWAYPQPAHEGPVDLEELQREALQVGQRRVARAEVVQTDVQPDLPHLFQGLPHGRCRGPRVQSARNGLWLTTVDGFTVLIGPNQVRRPSQDTRWHVCLGGDDLDPSATETITCVFEPPHS